MGDDRPLPATSDSDPAVHVRGGVSAVDRSWPELGEELARKALETLQEALHKHLVEGTMSERELRIVVDTITDTTMGLIAKDVTDTIYAVRKGLTDGK